MATSNRALLQATCLIVTLLILDATAYAQARKYCDEDFHQAVFDTCARQKRSGGFSLSDFMTMNRLRGSALGDGAFYVSGLQKRTSFDGIASFCCLHGCTPEELAVVC